MYVAAAVRGYLVRHREEQHARAGNGPMRRAMGAGQGVAAAIRRQSRKIAIQAYTEEEEEDEDAMSGQEGETGAEHVSPIDTAADAGCGRTQTKPARSRSAEVGDLEWASQQRSAVILTQDALAVLREHAPDIPVLRGPGSVVQSTSSSLSRSFNQTGPATPKAVRGGARQRERSGKRGNDPSVATAEVLAADPAQHAHVKRKGSFRISRFFHRVFTFVYGCACAILLYAMGANWRAACVGVFHRFAEFITPFCRHAQS